MLLRRWWLSAAILVSFGMNVQAESPPEPARLALKAVAAEESGLTHLVNSDAKLGKAEYPWMSPPVDIDGDGDLDAIVYGHHGGGAAIWLGRGDGTFTLDDGAYTKRWVFGARDPVWWHIGTAKAPHGIGTEGSKISGRLFLNDGAGQFHPTELSVANAGFGAFQFADVDGDGFHRELFITGSGTAVRLKPSLEEWTTAGEATQATNEKLWEAEPLVGWPSGIERGRGPGKPGYRDAHAVDFDGDDKNELIVHFRGEGFTPTVLFTWLLVRTNESADAAMWKIANKERGLPQDETAFLSPEDVDADGDLDLVDLHSGRWFVNDGGGKFAASKLLVFDPTKRIKGRTGLPWTGDCEFQWLDLDNNGYRDFLTASDHGSHNGAFLNLGGGKFVETADAPGTRRNRKFGDVNGDGRLDMISFLNNQVKLHRNESKGNGLHLSVVPREPADAHLGTKVWVYEAGKLGNAAALVHYRQGFMYRDGGRSTILGGPQHVGIGDRETVDMRVRFPSGVVREAKAAKAGSEIVLREAE